MIEISICEMKDNTIVVDLLRCCLDIAVCRSFLMMWSSWLISIVLSVNGRMRNDRNLNRGVCPFHVAKSSSISDGDVIITKLVRHWIRINPNSNRPYHPSRSLRNLWNVSRGSGLVNKSASCRSVDTRSTVISRERWLRNQCTLQS
jgi:hypothetical protein